MKIEKSNIPIQIECICSTQGVITPRWFRYETDEHEIITVTIERIHTHKAINFVGIPMLQYICSAVIQEKESIFELRYYVEAHRWIFFQMLS